MFAACGSNNGGGEVTVHSDAGADAANSDGGGKLAEGGTLDGASEASAGQDSGNGGDSGETLADAAVDATGATPDSGGEGDSGQLSEMDSGTDATITTSDGGNEAGSDAGPAGPPGLYYAHTDHLGTPQLVTDGSQNVVWSTTYPPYGTTGTVTASITQNLRLPGQYADSETGFNHNGFRDYMPNMGRYLEADPVGLGGGINRYVYANTDPAKHIDPRGLDPHKCHVRE